MRYYKVGKNIADKEFYKFNHRKNIWEISTVLIENELYTERELKLYGINPSALQVVDVPKNKTYWFFGSRFENMK